jgi:hypothetical protein
MCAQTFTADELVATVDARDLSSIRWGFLRQMFPKFVEDIDEYASNTPRRVPTQANDYGAPL